MKPMTPPRTPSALARWAPMGVLVLVLGLIALLIVTADPPGSSETAAPGDSTPQNGGDDVELPEGVLPFSVAEERGEVDDIEWGERCDVDNGVLKLPMTPPPECFAPYLGPAGGATSTGVTGDSIRVVIYTNQENDPILSFVYGQVGATDTPAQAFETYENYNEMLGTYFETYGRTIELVRYAATGPINDEVAATADAETIARDLKPFMVLGGPQLTGAFAETLAANNVMCIVCTPGQTNDWYVEHAPYVWDVQKSSHQSTQMAAEYIGKRLAGGIAEHGGDEVADKPRQFGLVYLDTGPQTDEIRSDFESALGDYDVEFVDVASFTDPVSLAGYSREIMARFRSKGITTVVFIGDPLAPQTLTEAATAQDYYPEWVMTGSALVDTSIFARTYDQAQWAHAFGPSNLFARVSPEVAGAAYLHRWYFGEPPPATATAPLILPSLQVLYSVLQGVGLDLTPETFQAVVFAADIVEGNVLSPQVSWGDRGLWPATDYTGVDDQTEVWWDADAVGVDETGRVASGMWTYVDGGRRYLPGEWPEEPAKVFDPDGAVSLYEELPPGIVRPSYEPLRG